MPRVAERFWAKVDKTGDCWVWTGARYSAGYGKFGIAAGKTAMAHRVAYELAVGPIPDGLHIDHLCRHKWCVNPAHLEPVTQRINTLRTPGGVAVRNAAAITCPQGHAYDEANTRVSAGMRFCRTCDRQRARERRALRRRAQANVQVDLVD